VTVPTAHDHPLQYATVSCHVEYPLRDDVWQRYRALLAMNLGGFRITSLLRPPDPSEAGADATWLERAAEAARYGPIGHHTHFGGPTTARPVEGSPPPAERVRAEAAWLREHDVPARFFCGGAWYIDEAVAHVLADEEYVDCTATEIAPPYLHRDAPRAQLDKPAWLVLTGGRRLLELPTSHWVGRLLRTPPWRLPATVHFYFHDEDLLERRRRSAIVAALRLLGRLRRARDLDDIAAEARRTAPDKSWAEVAG
jgi:hypothetical protein